MKVVIDRFEGDFAVVELSDCTMVNLPRVLVPSANEGDVITIQIDRSASNDRKTQIDELANKLWTD